MALVKKCECGNPLPPYTGKGRRPTKCTFCRSGSNKRAVLTPVTVILPAVEEDVPQGEPMLIAVTRVELSNVGRLQTSDGAAAVELARAIAMGGHPGAALASMVREYRAAMKDALTGVQGAREAVSGGGRPTGIATFRDRSRQRRSG